MFTQRGVENLKEQNKGLHFLTALTLGLMIMFTNAGAEKEEVYNIV